MGIVADTSVFTICERRRWTPRQVSLYLASLYNSEEIVIASVAAAELVHGIYRAKTDQQFSQRSAFIHLLLASYSIVPFTAETAAIAGRIRGEQARDGNMLPLADSLIAATAIQLDFAVLTHNVKDFARVPGVRVLPFALP